MMLAERFSDPTKPNPQRPPKNAPECGENGQTVAPIARLLLASLGSFSVDLTRPNVEERILKAVEALDWK